MKLAVVDDNERDSSLLSSQIERWALEKHIQVDITVYESGSRFLDAYRQGMFQLVFMDVFMEGEDGLCTVRRLRERGENVRVVFLTTSVEHIFEAAPLHIFDYIRKPCTYERIRYVLDEMRRTLPSVCATLEFSCGKAQVVLKLEEILYIEADNNYSIFTLKNGVQKYRIFFSQVWELLSDGRFLISTRGVAVNMDYIQRPLPDAFEMSDGRKLPIRRNGRKEILETYHQYQFLQLENI